VSRGKKQGLLKTSTAPVGHTSWENVETAKNMGVNDAEFMGVLEKQ
jgi:hypothetical protein